MQSSALAIMANNAAEAAKSAASAATRTPEGLAAIIAGHEAEGAASGVKVLAGFVAMLSRLRFPGGGSDGMDAKKAAEAVRLAFGMASEAWQGSNRKKQCGIAQKVAADYEARAGQMLAAADGSEMVTKAIGWLCNLTGVNDAAALTVEAVRNVYFPPRGGAKTEDEKAEAAFAKVLSSIASMERAELLDVVRAAIARKRTLDNPANAPAASQDVGAERRAAAVKRTAEAEAKRKADAEAATLARKARREAEAAEAAAALEAAAKAAEAEAEAAANG